VGVGWLLAMGKPARPGKILDATSTLAEMLEQFEAMGRTSACGNHGERRRPGCVGTEA